MLRLAAFVPVVAITAVAGIVSSPAKVRPCGVEYSKGIHGNLGHLILGRDGNLYATEEPQRKILQFNPDTHDAREFDVGVEPHDSVQGPDGRVWFTSLNGKLSPSGKPVTAKQGGGLLGALNVKTGQVTYYPGISNDAQPHAVLWSTDGKLYITEQKAGRLAIFDPNTKKIEQGRFGLPQGNFIHDITLLPNGDLWADLQGVDQLARFNLAKQRFDRFVKVPLEQGGPRDITYVGSKNAIYATLFAGNQLVEYDLDSGKLTLYPSHFGPISYHDAVFSRKDAKLGFVRPDGKGALWIATLSGGELIRFDLKTHKMTRLGCGLSAPTTTLGIATDRRGRLWFNELFPTGRIVRVET
jgi:streptogramin lyase